MAEPGGTSVRIPAGLLEATAGEQVITVAGESVRDALAEIDRRHPGFAERLLDVSGVRRGYAVYLDGSNIRLAAGLDTRLAASSTVTILPVAGAGPKYPA